MFPALADHCRSSQKIKSLLEMWLQILKAAHHVMNTDGPSGRKPRTTVVHMFIRQDTDTEWWIASMGQLTLAAGMAWCRDPSES